MSRKAHIEAARAEAERLGFSFSLVRNNGHYIAEIRKGDKARKISLSLSPSDNRALMNCCKDVRRVVREMEQI